MNLTGIISALLEDQGARATVDRVRSRGALDVIGPATSNAGSVRSEGDLGTNDPDAPEDALAALAASYLGYRKVSIFGGSNEIQRTILAKAVLGL